MIRRPTTDRVPVLAMSAVFKNKATARILISEAASATRSSRIRNIFISTVAPQPTIPVGTGFARQLIRKMPEALKPSTTMASAVRIPDLTVA